MPLIKLCEKNKIVLDELGNVVFKKCNNKNIVTRLSKKVDLVKFALMLKDLNFGFKHLEHL